MLAPYAEGGRRLQFEAAFTLRGDAVKHEVVRDLKSLLLGCARDPRWLAAMAGELDKLANGCDRRNNALIAFKDVQNEPSRSARRSPSRTKTRQRTSSS